MATSLAGYASSINPVSQIVCAYASGSTTLSARTGTPRWIVIGNFTVPEQVRARLYILGLVTVNATCSVALFDPTLVDNSTVAMIVGGPEQTTRGDPIDLSPGKRYQIAACVATDSQEGVEDKFAVIRTVSLGDL
jgi:hypothetical protein